MTKAIVLVSCLLSLYSTKGFTQGKAIEEEPPPTVPTHATSTPVSAPVKEEPKVETKLTVSEVKARAKTIEKNLFKGKTRLDHGFYTDDFEKMGEPQKKEALVRLQAVNRILGDIEKLAEKGVIKAGYPSPIGFAFNSTNDYFIPTNFNSRGVTLKLSATYDELKEFFEKLPAEAVLEKQSAELEKKAAAILKKTGITVAWNSGMSFGAKGYQRAEFEDVKKSMAKLEEMLPAIEKKAIATVNLGGFNNNYDESRLDLSLSKDHKDWTDTIEKSRPVTSEATLKEIDRVATLTDSKEVADAIKGARKTLEKFDLGPQRLLNKKRAEFTEKFGFDFFFDDPKLAEPKDRLALYEGMLAQAGKLKANRPKLQLYLSGRQKEIGPATVSGRISMPGSTSIEKMIEVVNAVPDAATWKKMDENVKRRIDAVAPLFGKQVGIHLDNGLISHDQALTALNTLEDISKKGYQARPVVETFFLTGAQVSGYPGVTRWSGRDNYLVIRSDFNLSHLMPFLERKP